MKIVQPDSSWIAQHDIEHDELVVVTTRDELALMANSIGEALQAVEGWEFHTRLGSSPDQAIALRDQLSDVLRASFRPE